MAARPGRRRGRLAALTTAVTLAAAAAGTASAGTVSAGTVEAATTAPAPYWTPARMASATPVTSPSPPGTPSPTYSDGVPTVGALFFTTGKKSHFCTASVVDSDSNDMILTAAHCVYDHGYATHIAYVPEWHNGASPYGVWPVRSITVASGWQQSHDAGLDFAFLKVAPPSGQSLPVQAVTGGLQLGIDQGYANQITAIGYNDTDSQPISCATNSFESRPGQQEFYCNGFWNGTSGGPMITNYDPADGTGTVVGVIGGYQRGGHYKWASYSDYFGDPVQQLFLQAQTSP